MNLKMTFSVYTDGFKRYWLTFADLHISVETLSDFRERFLRYSDTFEADADITVHICPDEILKETERQNGMDTYRIEEYLIYRKICNELPRFNAFMLHAATLEYDGRAYAFCAKSGTGKSTHAELWKYMLGNKCRYINGDKPIIRMINEVPTAFGSPWNGKEGRGENISAPLSGICFIKRGETPSIRKLETNEGLFRIISVSHRPENHEFDDDFYYCIGNVVENVPMYELTCDISAGAAKLSFETLTYEVI